VNFYYTVSHTQKNRLKSGVIHTDSYSKGTWDISQGIRRPKCLADHSPTSRASIKNEWNHNAISPYMSLSSVHEQLYVCLTNKISLSDTYCIWYAFWYVNT